MIRERALCAAMKQAWRETGYEVFARGDTLVIRTKEMGVEMIRKNASRKVLALLVEHLGEIPDGTAYSVRKTPGPQQMMPDVAMAHWDSVRNRVEGAERHALRRTPMNWKNREIWQADDTCLVYAFDEELTDIICAEPKGIEVADGLMVCDDGGGLVVVDAAQGVISDEIRDLLEQISLT